MSFLDPQPIDLGCNGSVPSLDCGMEVVDIPSFGEHPITEGPNPEEGGFTQVHDELEDEPPVVIDDPPSPHYFVGLDDPASFIGDIIRDDTRDKPIDDGGGGSNTQGTQGSQGASGEVVEH